MIRLTLAALATLWISRAHAAPPPGILVLDDWGVYSAAHDHRVADPNATTGYSTFSRDVRLVERTHQVCAQLGADFGIRFHVRDDVPAAVLTVSVDVTHPPMMNNHGAMQSHDEMTRQARVHGSTYSGWTFSEPRELVAGEWHVTVRRAGVMEIDEIFHVHTACTATIS